MPQHFVYGLTDPRDGEIRYIGYTSIGMERPEWHAKDKTDSWKARWIRSLQREGERYGIVIIEVLHSPDGLHERERHWIAHHRALGARLTNGSNGGEGVPGLVFSDEHRRKLSVAAKKRGYTSNLRLGGGPKSPEQRAKISASLTGKTHSVETKRKRSDSMKRARAAASPEAEARLREGNAKSWTPERREKHSEMMRHRHAEKKDQKSLK